MADPALEVVLVDDQLGARRATELLLGEGGFRVAGTAAGFGEARGLLRHRRYDAALLAPTLAGEPVAGLLAEIGDDRPDAPLVVWAGEDVGPAALAALAAARPAAIVARRSPPARLFEALRAAAAGTPFADPALLARPPAEPEPGAGPPATPLTRREREILRLLASGLSGAEVAERLVLSAETVRTHVRNATGKLGARTRAQAVARFVIAEITAGRGL